MGRFDRWAAVGPSVLAVTDDPAAADFAVLPATWNHYARAGAVALAEAFARTAADAGLRLIVFVESDPNAVSSIGALRSELRHRLRPMSGRDPRERGRSEVDPV